MIRRFPARHLIPVLIWILAGTTGGALFNALRVPVGWLLGAMLASMLLGLVVRPPGAACNGGTMAGQWIIATMTGSAFSMGALRDGLPYVGTLMLLIVFTSSLCLLNGWLLQRLAGVDAATGFLGSLPGAAAAVVGMAADMKVDLFMVTMLMYIRVILITALVPLVLTFWSGGMGVAAAGGEGRAFAEITPSMALVSILLAGLVAMAASRLRLPSPNFLPPFLFFALFRAIFPEIQLGLPAPVFTVGLLLLGASVGARFELKRVLQLWHPALIQSGLVLGLLAACMASGYVFHRLTGVDLLTAVLGTTPGGKEAMVALSMALGGNVELVIVMQTVRWLVILLAGPVVAVWMARKSGWPHVGTARTTEGEETYEHQ